MQPDNLQAKLKQFGIYDQKQYHEQAFSRNIGLFSKKEQEALKNAKVAIPGMGGVGGVHLITMARTGIGRFHLADYDTYEPVNINRQYGARVPDFGRPKLEVMCEQALAVNPYLEITPFPQGIDESSLDPFLDGVQVVLDGLDFFQFEIRRTLFNRAREKGVYVVTAAPLGFSSAVLIFSPHDGMSFDEYFNIVDGMTTEQQYLAFAMGLAPRGTHMKYMDLKKVSLENKAGPSLNIACQSCAAMAATEAVRIILNRGRIKPVPHYFQFDPYAQKFCRGKLYMGNRNPLQKLKSKAASYILQHNKKTFKRTPPNKPLPAPDEKTITEEMIRYIIEAGIQAPSGDNAQPWKFAYTDNTIDLYLDRDADRSFFNVKQIASIISCGAVLENMRIAATALGISAQIDYLPNEGIDDHMATLSLFKTGKSKSQNLIVETLWERHTNRTLYIKKPIPPAILNNFESLISQFPGTHLHLITHKADLKKLAKLVYKVDRIRTEHRPLHEHLCNMIRFSEAETSIKKDGLPLKNLEAGFTGEFFLKATRSWRVMSIANKLGLGRMVAAHAMASVMNSTCAALITVDGIEPQDFLIGGQALERIWLMLSEKGLYMQPMAAVTLFKLRWIIEGKNGFSISHQRLLNQVWNDYHNIFPNVNLNEQGQVMLFRIGYSKPIECFTRRKGIESFIKSIAKNCTL